MKNNLIDITNTQFDTSPFHIFLVDNIDALETPWVNLQNQANVTIYQHFLWQKAWYDAHAEKPHSSLFVIAFIKEQPAFILPLICFEKLGLTLAKWSGGEHANYNMGLYHPGFLKKIEDQLPHILRLAGKKAPQKIDLFLLEKQPYQWGGTTNPMHVLTHHKSSYSAASVSLERDFETVLKRGNAKRKRKILRSQERALEKLGGYTIKRTQSASDAEKLYQIFQNQKEEWFLKRGIHNKFDDKATHLFFKLLAQYNHKMLQGNHLIEFDYIEADGQILSLLAGGIFKGQHFGYFTSMTNNEKYKNISPGALTFYKRIEKACHEGLRRFDFGVGAERYKTSWCDEIHVLFDVALPVSLKARPYILFISIQTHLKKKIKDNPVLWSQFKKLRQHIAGKKSA